MTKKNVFVIGSAHSFRSASADLVGSISHILTFHWLKMIPSKKSKSNPGSLPLGIKSPRNETNSVTMQMLGEALSLKMTFPENTQKFSNVKGNPIFNIQLPYSIFYSFRMDKQ